MFNTKYPSQSATRTANLAHLARAQGYAGNLARHEDDLIQHAIDDMVAGVKRSSDAEWIIRFAVKSERTKCILDAALAFTGTSRANSAFERAKIADVIGPRPATMRRAA